MSRTLLVATRKGLFRLRKKGKDWRVTSPDFLAVPVSMALQDPRDGATYAALDHGHFGVKLHRCDGKEWQEIAAPVYPPAPDGVEEKDAIGRPWPRKLKLVWSLEIDPTSDGGLWCGTIPGGLFRSVDRGASWELVESLWNEPKRKDWMGGGADLPGIHSICVHPHDPKDVRVGVSCGGIWRTTDAGATWQVSSHGMRQEHIPPEQTSDAWRQDVHRVVQCPAAPERIWAQHHNGIFRSKKDGVSFKEIEAKAPSRFGFPVVVHPEDPDTAWFVPAVKDECRVPVDGRLCVIRTRDGGKTFDVQRKGLPQEDCFDLVYRHGLDISADGEQLAMGSTTGGLWTSANGGKSWTQVDARLPPIYAVRFGAK
jgi:hypothetical protein